MVYHGPIFKESKSNDTPLNDSSIKQDILFYKKDGVWNNEEPLSTTNTTKYTSSSITSSILLGNIKTVLVTWNSCTSRGL